MPQRGALHRSVPRLTHPVRLSQGAARGCGVRGPERGRPPGGGGRLRGPPQFHPAGGQPPADHAVCDERGHSRSARRCDHADGSACGLFCFLHLAARRRARGDRGGQRGRRAGDAPGERDGARAGPGRRPVPSLRGRELLFPDRCRGATPGGHRAVRVLSPRGLRPHRCVRRRSGPESGRRAECTPAEAGRADHAHSRSGLPLLRPRLARPGGPHVLSVRLLQATRGVEGRPDHDVAPGRPRPVRRRAGRDGRARSRLVAGAACRRGPGRRLPRRGPGVRCPGGSTPRRALRRGAAAGVPHTALLVRSGLHHRRAGARYREAATAPSRRIGAAVAMTPLLAVASFGYHEVTDHPGTAGFQRPGALPYKHTGEAFTRNLDAIAAASCPPERVTDLDLTRPGRHVLLTFDDGGKSAVPIGDALAARGWKGHFFIVTGLIGSRRLSTAAEIRYLHGCGHVVGSHSDTHPDIFREQPWDRMIEEWRVSRDKLAQLLGAPCRTASVPGGDRSPLVLRSAGAAGLAYLFTSEPVLRPESVGERWILGRFMPKAWTPAARIGELAAFRGDRKSTRLNSSHGYRSYAVFCL